MDQPDVTGWSSFHTDYDTSGNVTSQTGVNDGGSSWVNTYDTAGNFNWSYMTSVYDAGHNLVSQTQTNDDGTHSLTAYDTTNSDTWSSFVMTFDANWNVTSLSGTNDDGSHTLDSAEITGYLDTLTWYANPRVVSEPAELANTASDGSPALEGKTDVGPVSASAAPSDSGGNDNLQGLGLNDFLTGSAGNDTIETGHTTAPATPGGNGAPNSPNAGAPGISGDTFTFAALPTDAPAQHDETMPDWVYAPEYVAAHSAAATTVDMAAPVGPDAHGADVVNNAAVQALLSSLQVGDHHLL